MERNNFFRKILLMVFLLFILDKGLGSLLQYYYFKIRHGELGRTTYAIDSCVAETLILGSSRAEHHYVSPVISGILNTSCYNAGKDKQRLRYCQAMLQMIYKRYSPKQIILDLTPTAFETNENGLDELSILLPYYKSHPEIRSIINERNRFEWVKTFSYLYCYNSLPLKIIFNNLSGNQDSNEINGYVPLKIHKEVIADIPEMSVSLLPVDSSLVNCFKSIIKLTKEHRSKLYVVVSPIFYQLPKNIQTIVMAKSICDQEKINFMDYSQLPQFLAHGPKMFMDSGHLNDSSAIVFSTLLSGAIIKL